MVKFVLVVVLFIRMFVLWLRLGDFGCLLGNVVIFM